MPCRHITHDAIFIAGFITPFIFAERFSPLLLPDIAMMLFAFTMMSLTLFAIRLPLLLRDYAFIDDYIFWLFALPLFSC